MPSHPLFSNSNSANMICIDPSCLGSPKKIKNLEKLLNTLREYQKIKVVIPTIIYELLTKRRDAPYDFETRKKIGNTWKMATMGYRANYMEKMFVDEKLFHRLRNLFEISDLVPVEKIIQPTEKLGKKSIFRDNVIKKLGDIVGDIVWEMLSVSEKLGGSIITFGEKTISLISRLGVPVFKGYSKYKKGVKRRAKIQNTLRFLIFVMSVKAFESTVGDYAIEGFPLTLPEIGTLGILIVANG